VAANAGVVVVGGAWNLGLGGVGIYTGEEWVGGVRVGGGRLPVGVRGDLRRV
jgi:hypothetical protein